MNWTGGSLSRSRKQNTNLSVIQKKHFAKARGTLLNGRPTPPRIDLSFFQSPETETKVASPGTLPNHSHSKYRRSQHILDEYEVVRPVVRQLQSLRSREAGNTSARSRLDNALSSSEQHSARQADKKGTILHNTSELCLKNGNEHRPAIQDTATGYRFDNLEAKRQELLRAFDWVGLEKMKPVKIKFADAEDRDLIGKRRRLQANHEASAPRHQRRIFNAYEKLDMLRAKSSVRSSPEKISVHIGSSDHLFSHKNGSQHGSRKGISYGGPPSEKMLFQDRESVSASNRRSGSLRAGLQQGLPSSEEMLFDREWSCASPPPTFEPANNTNDSYRQPKHQTHRDIENDTNFRTIHMISSGDESDNSTDHYHIEEDLERHQDQETIAYEEDRLHLPENNIPSDLPKPIRIDELDEANRLAIGHEEGHENRLYKESTEEISPTGSEADFDKSHGNEEPFALATALELATLLPGADTGRETRCGPHELHDLGEESVTLARREVQNGRDASMHTIAEKNESTNRCENEVAQPLPSSPDPPASAPVKSTSPLPKSPIPAPAPASGAPIQQETFPAPDDRSPAEDELLWRKFVFGTEHPDDDWIFSQPLEKAKKLATQHSSSSPLLPAFAQARREREEETDDDHEEQGSAVIKTQPSLLAEASSSSASFLDVAQSIVVDETGESSPARPQPLPSTVAGALVSASSSASISEEEARTESPTRTQHSVQAQAATSIGSFDGLALSSPKNGPSAHLSGQMDAQRQPHALQPPVIFTRPKRYVGDSWSSAAPVRLGAVETRARKRRNDVEDAEYQERGKRRKGKESRDKIARIQAELEDDGMEDDEIID
ncbi:MAG: hypothetical protein Q9202_004700 [Teloschistes flavicans]